MNQKPPRIREKLILTSSPSPNQETLVESVALAEKAKLQAAWDTTHQRAHSSPAQVLATDGIPEMAPELEHVWEKSSLNEYWSRKRSCSAAHLDQLHSRTWSNIAHEDVYTGMQRSVLVNGNPLRGNTRSKLFVETLVVSRIGTPAIDLTKPERRPSRASEKEAPALYAHGLLKIDHRGVRLWKFEDLPAWMQDNPYLTSGYRLYTSYKENWFSTLQWHNETVNIWTHWLGSLLFVALIVYSSVQLSPNASPADRAMFAFYSLTACITLFLSGLFHTHYPTSERALVIFCSLDTAGISLLTAGSAMLMAYYSMYCMKAFQGMWLGLLILVNLVGIVGPFFKQWTMPRFRVVRTVSLLAAAGLSVAPILMAIGIQGGIPNDWPMMTAVWISVCVACYLLGAVVYVFQIPERWFPGRFDFVGASHQIWHCLVVAAAVALFLAGFDLFQWQFDHACNI